jgi:hypothetical protein
VVDTAGRLLRGARRGCRARPAGSAPPERMVEGCRRAQRTACLHTRRGLRGARAGCAQLADAVRQCWIKLRECSCCGSSPARTE